MAKAARKAGSTRLGRSCPTASTRSASSPLPAGIVLAVRGPRVPAGRGALRAPGHGDQPIDHPAGLLLAAGAGRRMGGPKALVELDGEPLVRRALRVLADGGCAPLVVVLGAAAADVAEVLPPSVGSRWRPTGPRAWAPRSGRARRAAGARRCRTRCSCTWWTCPA